MPGGKEKRRKKLVEVGKWESLHVYLPVLSVSCFSRFLLGGHIWGLFLLFFFPAPEAC